MYKRGLWPMILLAVLWCSGAGARGKRAEITKQPRYDVHRTDQMLPRDKQVSTFLNKGNPKTYFYWSEIPISVTITPCMSELKWSVRYRHKNDTSAARLIEPVLGEFTTREMRTYNIKPQRGLFVIELEATESDSYAHIYVSTEPGGPQALQVSNMIPRMRFFNRQSRKKLTLRWNQSLVDPQVTEYCLVVSTKRNYTTLCEALEKRFGVYPPEDNNLDLSKPMNKVLQRKNDSYEDPIINCVGRQTFYTFTNLKNGEFYIFNLFASNPNNKLTYLYGSVKQLFNNHKKPKALRDGIPTSANLKKDDGKSVFRYKVGRNTKESLRVLVMPCGGAVDVEISLKGKIIKPRQRVDGYRTLVVKKPTIGQRYYIRIFSSNREELKKTSSVEVLATTKPEGKFPLPRMPSHPQVIEYNSLRKCNSITVGWKLSPDRRAANYCLVVREGPKREMEGYRMPNQCGLESRLKKSADIILNHCIEISHGKQGVVTHEIKHLKPDKKYIVQVVIKSKKPGSKTLSYDLLQVETKPTCEPL